MKQIISTDRAPAAIGPYSQAVRAGEYLYISGQLALDPATMELKGNSAPEQARVVFENIGAILESAGLAYSDVVKTTVLMADIGDFAEVNTVYGEFFTRDFPARAAYQVAALPKGGLIEVEAIAYAGKN